MRSPTPDIERASARAEREIARLRETIQKLTESEALYRTLVESSPEAIVIADLNRTVIMANRQAVTLFGASSAEALAGRPVMNLVFPGGIPPAGDFWQRLLDTGVARVWECPLARLDGSPFIADLSVSLSPDTGGGASYLVVIVRDVTPRRQSEDAAREIAKMEALGRFAGGVAHEFNNLFSIIRGYSELLLKRLPEDDTGGKKARQIVVSVDRAGGLVRQLLTFSRRQVPQPKVVEVNRALAHLDDTLRRMLRAEIALEFQLDPAAGCVLIDPGDLAQIVMNLVANGRDAIPGSGTITIRSRLLPPYVVLSVADTGMGMTEAIRSRIFEPFFTTKEAGQGVGLGLAAVYGSVERAGGRITVETRPGQGATVSIHLPVYKAAESKP
jgi:PAS domain S-box-containing protein